MAALSGCVSLKFFLKKWLMQFRDLEVLKKKLSECFCDPVEPSSLRGLLEGPLGLGLELGLVPGLVGLELQDGGEGALCLPVEAALGQEAADVQQAVRVQPGSRGSSLRGVGGRAVVVAEVHAEELEAAG